MYKKEKRAFFSKEQGTYGHPSAKATRNCVVTHLLQKGPFGFFCFFENASHYLPSLRWCRERAYQAPTLSAFSVFSSKKVNGFCQCSVQMDNFYLSKKKIKSRPKAKKIFTNKKNRITFVIRFFEIISLIHNSRFFPPYSTL